MLEFILNYDKGVAMEKVTKKKELDTISDYIDIKLTEADDAIKNGAKFYSREEVDKILSVIMKQNVQS